MFGTPFVTDLLEHYLNNAAHTNVGDAGGLLPSATGGSLYFAAHTAFPGRTGTAAVNEASYTGYARVAVTRADATFFSVAGNEGTTLSAATFPKQTDGGTDILMFWSLTVASSGTSQIIAIGPFGGGAPKIFTAATDDIITSDAHGMSNGDRVVLAEVADDRPFPTGLTEGTVYFVRDVLTNSFKVEATSGGGAIDITAAGVGRWQRVVPVQMGENVAPSIDVGARIIIA